MNTRFVPQTQTKPVENMSQKIKWNSVQKMEGNLRGYNRPPMNSPSGPVNDNFYGNSVELIKNTGNLTNRAQGLMDEYKYQASVDLNMNL